MSGAMRGPGSQREDRNSPPPPEKSRLNNESQVGNLFGIHFAGTFVHGAGRLGVFWEGDDFPDGFLSGHDHDEAVQSWSEASMRGRSVLEGLKEESEPLFGQFLGEAHNIEYSLL